MSTPRQLVNSTQEIVHPNQLCSPNPKSIDLQTQHAFFAQCQHLLQTCIKVTQSKESTAETLAATAVAHPLSQVFIEMAAFHRQLFFNAMLVLFGTREAGCFGEVAALYSDHLR